MSRFSYPLITPPITVSGGPASGYTAVGTPADGTPGISNSAGVLTTDTLTETIDKVMTYAESILETDVIKSLGLFNAMPVAPNMLYSNGANIVDGSPAIIRGILALADTSAVTFDTVTANAFVSPGGFVTNAITATSTAPAFDLFTGAIISHGGITARQSSFFTDLSVADLSIRNSGTLDILNTTNAVSTTTGALTCKGGAGFIGDVYSAGTLVGNALAVSTINANNANINTITSTNLSISTIATSGSTDSTSPTTGSIVASGGLGVLLSVNIGNNLKVFGNENATSLSTGAFRVVGGASVTADMFVGGNLVADTTTVGQISTTANVISGATNMILSAPGEILLTQTNTSPLGIATVGQLQLSALGISPYLQVHTKTAENLQTTYATLVLTSMLVEPIPTIGGYTPNIGDRILVTEQTDATENGIYTVTGVGGVSPWTLTRADDFDVSADIRNNSFVSVVMGDFGGGGYILLGSAPFILDTDDLVFTQFATIPIPTIVNNSELSPGFGVRNVSGIQPTDTIASALDRVQTIIDKISPESPATIDVYTSTSPYVLVEQTYSAKIAGTNTIVDHVVNTTTPHVSDTGVGFGSAISGVVTAYKNDGSDIIIGTLDLTITPTAPLETNGGVQITRTDFSLIESSVLVAINTDNTEVFTPSTLLRNFHVRVVDGVSKISNSVLFRIDDAYTMTPTITTHSITGNTTAGTYVSGVPIFDVGDTITMSVTATNCVGVFYNSAHVVQVTSNETTIATHIPISPIGDITALIPVTISANVCSENTQFTLLCRNAASVESVHVLFTNTAPVRIDSKSILMQLNETVRVSAGAGEFPVVMGGAFDPTVSLATNQELQLSCGAYRYPAAVDYSNNLLPGPNYTSLSGFRYAAFRFPSILIDTVAFDLVFSGINPSEWVDDIVQPVGDFTLQVQVQGGAIFDANIPFNYISPTINGDACLDTASPSTTLSVKRITFGSVPRTGDLVIRIGFPVGSTKSISGITITNIIA